MGIFDAIQTGLAELLSHKMRSMLTMLGVIFGVAAVIAMVSIGEGAKQEALQQIREMGVDVIHIQRGVISGELLTKAQETSPNGLNLSDATNIREVCTFVKQVVPVREVFADVKQGEKPLPVRVVGTTTAYAAVAPSRCNPGAFSSTVTKRTAITCACWAQRPSACSSASTKRSGAPSPSATGSSPSSACWRIRTPASPRGTSAIRDVNSDIYIPLAISVTDFQLFSQQAIPATLTSRAI